MAAVTALASAGSFVSASPLVVRREKRRRRKAQARRGGGSIGGNSSRVKRHGFVFDDPSESKGDQSMTSNAASSGATKSHSDGSAHTFVFRVKKMKRSAKKVDSASASEALMLKKERMAKIMERRQSLQRRKVAMQAEEKFEAGLEGKLNHDQRELYHSVRTHIKREIRKTRKDFQHSAARADIMQLTEMSLSTLKEALVSFMMENPPSPTLIITPNPENARLNALVHSYEAKIDTLSAEEAQWTKMMNELESTTEQTQAAGSSELEEASPSAPARDSVPVKVNLELAHELTQLQQHAISQVEASAKRLAVVDDSMKSIDRLILQAEISKSALFDAFHGSAFKAYHNIGDPKETLRALFRLRTTANSS